MTTLPEGFIPTRHRRSPDVARMLGLLHRFAPAIAEPDAARWDEIGRSLMQGDPEMDALLTAMQAHGLRAARAQFERALADGLDAVPDAIPELWAFIQRYSTPPVWLDRARIERGADLFSRCGRNSLFVGRDVALLGGYQASAFNRTLILTGALQKGPARRLAETVRWSLDCTAPGGLEVHGIGWQSTLMVRFIHALVRRSVVARDDWQLADWGLPINQPDMAATLYGSLTVPVLGARLLGMPQSRRERDDAAHLVRYVGWLIGVEERWLADTEGASMAQLFEFLLSLTNPDETSPMMAVPLADEPLSRPYPNLGWARGRIERSLHLSISWAFLGGDAMRKLGLPDRVLPWYPLLSIPVSLVRHSAARLIPGGRARLARRGRAAQEAYVRGLTPQQHAAVIGESVVEPRRA
jgi:hypothetical protein